MKVWSGTSTESGTCLICGHKTGAYSEFKASGVRLKLYACESQHLAFVQRQYASALIKPILMQARIIAHGRPGQGEIPNAGVVPRRGSDVGTSPLLDAIDAHVKQGGRIVFWTCPNGCSDLVDWKHEGKTSVATCRKCGASNAEHDTRQQQNNQGGKTS